MLSYRSKRATTPHPALWGAFLLLAPLACGEGPAELLLPEIVASSQTIDYRAWSGPWCMDEMLGEWDHFLTDSAAYLDAPLDRLTFTWVPEQLDAPDRWACGGELGCSRPDHAAVFSRCIERHDEMIRAIELTAYPDRHRLLRQGMALYMASWDWSTLVYDPHHFADELIAALSGGHLDRRIERSLAAHLVGWVVQRYGMERYNDFAARWPADSGYSEMQAAYAAAFGSALAEDLAAMSRTHVYGRRHERACDDDEALPVAPWGPSEGFSLTLTTPCGEQPTPRAAASDPTQPGFVRSFMLEIPETAAYTLRFDPETAAITAPIPATAELRGCADAGYALAWASADDTGVAVLQRGRYRLDVVVPPRPAAAADVEVALDFISALPPSRAD